MGNTEKRNGIVKRISPKLGVFSCSDEEYLKDHKSKVVAITVGNLVPAECKRKPMEFYFRYRFEEDGNLSILTGILLRDESGRNLHNPIHLCVSGEARISRKRKEIVYNLSDDNTVGALLEGYRGSAPLITIGGCRCSRKKLKIEFHKNKINFILMHKYSGFCNKDCTEELVIFSHSLEFSEKEEGLFEEIMNTLANEGSRVTANGQMPTEQDSTIFDKELGYYSSNGENVYPGVYILDCHTDHKECSKRIFPNNDLENDKVSGVASLLYNRSDIDTRIVYKSIMLERIPYKLTKNDNDDDDEETHSYMGTVYYGIFREHISGRPSGKPKTSRHNSYVISRPKNVYIATAKSSSNDDVNSLLLIVEVEHYRDAFYIFEISKKDKTGNFFDKMKKHRYVEDAKAIPWVDFTTDDYTVSRHTFVRIPKLPFESDFPIVFESSCKYEDENGLAFRLTGDLLENSFSVLLGLKLQVIRREFYGDRVKLTTHQFGDKFNLFEIVIEDMVRDGDCFRTEYFVLDALNSILDEIDNN